jgi:hypothetical protein
MKKSYFVAYCKRAFFTFLLFILCFTIFTPGNLIDWFRFLEIWLKNTVDKLSKNNNLSKLLEKYWG